MSFAQDPKLPTGNQVLAMIVRRDEGCPPIEYHLVQQIGDGNFGVVWKAQKDGNDVALKILKGSANSDDTRREISSLEALEGLRHEFLLQSHGYWLDGDRLIIEMELANGGSLKARLKQYKRAGMRGIPVAELLKYFREAAEALDYLHTRKPQFFLHRDIKPGNILLVNGCAKLADFGLLRQVASDKSQTHTTGGTQPYMSPESIVGDSASPRTDLFSLAVSFVELRQGRLPFPGDQPFTIMKKIVDDPPELSDEVFGPAEKAVLHKALDKTPARRHRSCGEFVTALIAAFPQEDLEFDPYDATAAPSGPGSLENETHEIAAVGTVKPGSSRKKTDPQFRAFDVNVPAKSSSNPSDTAKNDAKTEPSTLRPRRKTKRRYFLRVLLLPFFLSLIAGLWFLIHADTKENVRQLLKKEEFAKALETINGATPFLLPFPGEVEREVEHAWWKSLDPAGIKDKEALQRKQDEMEHFANAYQSHPGINKRRNEITLALTKLLDTKLPPNDPKVKPKETKISSEIVAAIDRLLIADSLNEARQMFADNEKSLSLADKSKVADRLANKQAVNDLLKKVTERFRGNHFEDALADLDAVKLSFDFPIDKKKWDDVFARAKNGEHARLVASAEDASKKGPQRALDAAKENLAKFRNRYPGDSWMPDLEKFQLAGNINDVIEKAWTALLENSIPECRAEIAKLRDEFKSDTIGNRNVRILSAFTEAHQAAGEASTSAAASQLIRVVAAEKGQLDDMMPKLWKALLKLEQQKNLFRFENIADLVVTMPAQPPEAGLQSKLVAHVLKRLVNSKECWCPNDKQWNHCLMLCQLIHPADENGWLLALHVESIVETKNSVREDLLNRLEDYDVWFAAYAGALAMQNTGLPKAANLLAGAMKKEPKSFQTSMRSTKALKLLRQAVGKLARDYSFKKNFINTDSGNAQPWLLPFKTPDDADKAKIWLSPIVALPGDKKQLLIDLTDLALAASRAKDAVTLTSTANQAEKLLEGEFGAAEKEQGFYWLGYAHRSAGSTGKRDDKVFRFYDQVLKFERNASSDFRRLAAKEGAEYARDLGNYHWKQADSDKALLDLAIKEAQECKQYATLLKAMTLEDAAELNRDAFALLLNATREKSPGDKKHEEMGKLFLAELPDKLDVFHMPIAVHKLKYLRSVTYFDEDGEYFKLDEGKKIKKNTYIEKTLAEARSVSGFKNGAEASKVGANWWKKTQQNLSLGRYDCLIDYAARGFKVVDEEPGEFNESHIPRLLPVLSFYLEARKLNPEVLSYYTDLKKSPEFVEKIKGDLLLSVGFTYVLLGHSALVKDKDQAIKLYYEKASLEFKQLSPAYRKLMRSDRHAFLREVEKELEKKLAEK